MRVKDMGRKQQKAVFANMENSSSSTLSNSDRDKILAREFPNKGKGLYGKPLSASEMQESLKLHKKGFKAKPSPVKEFPEARARARKKQADKIAQENKLPAGWQKIRLGKLLSNKQANEIIALSNKGEASPKNILTVIKKDTSKLKDKVLPEYLAYAITYELIKQGAVK